MNFLIAKFKKITVIVLLTVNFCCANEANKVSNSLDPEKPVITFEGIEKWKNFTLSDEDFGFYSEKGEVLYATCSAPYPIIWDITGFINPVSVLRIREPQRTLNPDNFTIKLAAFFNTAKNEPSLASSLQIRCFNPFSPSLLGSDEFSLYVKGNRNGTLLPPKKDSVLDSVFIPCPTTTPLEPVTLFKLNGKEDVKVEEGFAYVPWRGFKQENTEVWNEGVYLCRQGSSEVKVSVKKSPQNQTVKFHPKTEEKIRQFSDENVYLSCSSNSNESVELKFEGDSESKLTISYTQNSTEQKSVFISPVDKKSKRIEGKVICLKDQVPVKEWNFEFINAPEIFFDDYFSEMHCLTDFEEGDGVEVEAKSLRCANAIGCKYYERCLEEGNVCDHLGQVVYSEKRRSQCAPLADRVVKNCANLYYTSWNGVAQCKVDGLTKNFPYFTALDLHKYTDWRKVNASDLLRLEKEGNEFRCTGVGFLFANSLAFEVEFKNNSTELIQGNGKNGNVTIHEHPSPYKIYGFQVVSSLELFKPENVKSVRCVASHWPNTDPVKTPPYNL